MTHYAACTVVEAHSDLDCEPTNPETAPMVLIHVDGGIAEQWYTVKGTGTPAVHILDFDRGDEDEAATADFIETARETLAAFKARGVDTSDLEADLDDLEGDDEYHDGKTLIAGVLYDDETGQEADPQ